MAGSLNLSGVSGSRNNLPPNLLRSGCDTAPGVRPGGRANPPPDSGVIVPTPRTPDFKNDVRTRHRRRTEPGEGTEHWGMKQPDTARPGPGDGYGSKTARGEDVKENFQAGQLFGVAEYLHSRGEAIYSSTRREPLGGSYVRGHVLPAETKIDVFEGFGRKCGPTNDAKETIFPRGVPPETEEAKAQYRHTHGSYEPGESVSRAYKWPEHVAKDKHFAFGVSDGTSLVKPSGFGAGHKGFGVKSAMSMDREDDGTQPTTRVAQRTSEDCRKVVNDHLGTGRNLMQGKPPVAPDHAHGIKSTRDDKAGDLIRGFYTPREQQPDDDLGLCTAPGRRNFSSARVFGTPTVRDDIPAPHPHHRSVASVVNYGDEVDAYRLICPQRFEVHGVSDGDFRERLPKDDLQSIFESAGYHLAAQDFDAIFDCAAEWFGDDSQMVNLEVFMAVYGDWAAQQVVSGGGAVRESAGADLTAVPCS